MITHFDKNVYSIDIGFIMIQLLTTNSIQYKILDVSIPATISQNITIVVPEILIEILKLLIANELKTEMLPSKCNSVCISLRFSFNDKIFYIYSFAIY